MLDMERFRPAIAEVCERLKVRRLDVFGSATEDAFRAESDVDVLVRFDRDAGRLFERYFDLKDGLEQILGRQVDVVIEDTIKNPYFKMSIERSRRNLYAA